MMRSLWTGATGMIAQQTAVDTISNNLSNINTTGYKKETVEFKSLLYSKLQRKTTDNEGNPKPVIGQVGAGTRAASVTSRFQQGPLTETGNTTDLAISGSGFYQIYVDEDTTAYTRAGNFIFSLDSDGTALSTADGYRVVDTNGEPIVLDSSLETSRITIDTAGRFYYKEIDETITNLGIQIGLVQFNNPAGLEKGAGTLYYATDASGAPRLEVEDEALTKSSIQSGYLEGSNVQAVDEMVNLIVAQRAYEMNSKIISASDEMLQQANNLRG